MSPELRRLLEVFQRWLHLPDPAPLFVVLGTWVANHLLGDPVWVLLVGPPGCGKTETLRVLEGRKGAHPIGTITEAGLLSGTAKKDRAKTATGGLLRKIDPFGILLAKDFGSVLNMNREARKQLLAAFREVYDGSWTRVIGSDGGSVLMWTGKVGLIGACTESIDRYHEVMAAMGERFLLFRMPELDAEAQATRAIEESERSGELRTKLAAATGAFLDGLDLTGAAARPRDPRLVPLALLVAKCRSAVERDGYSREIELVPSAEVPGRIAKALDTLHAGFIAIGLRSEDAWSLVRRVALDCLPIARRRVLETLAASCTELGATAVGKRINLPESSARRHLEDLTAHGVLEEARGS